MITVQVVCHDESKLFVIIRVPKVFSVWCWYTSWLLSVCMCMQCCLLPLFLLGKFSNNMRLCRISDANEPGQSKPRSQVDSIRKLYAQNIGQDNLPSNGVAPANWQSNFGDEEDAEFQSKQTLNSEVCCTVFSDSIFQLQWTADISRRTTRGYFCPILLLKETSEVWHNYRSPIHAAWWELTKMCAFSSDQILWLAPCKWRVSHLTAYPNLSKAIA